MPSPLDNVASWTARRAEHAGARPALCDDELRLDATALDERCARAAGWLAARGVRRGERVALLLGNRTAFLELLLGAARLGAIAVPLNARLAPPEVRELLDDAAPRVLCVEADAEALARAALAGARRPPPVVLAVGGRPDAYEAALAGVEPRRAVEPVDPDDPMILMYTSGTTGVPKGALLPHRKTLYNALNAQLFFELTARDRVLVPLPLFHSFGLKILSLPALYAGAEVILQGRFHAARVWETVAERGITYLGGVPTQFQALYDALLAAPPGGYDLSTLRFLFTAGAPIPVELIRAFEARGLVLKQGFGQTETSILCCLEAADAVRKAGSVGRPVFHVDLRIVRPHTLARPVAEWEDAVAGETGEIVARGPITMLGYWDRPEATAETLREGWLLTGDLGSADAEGYVTLSGRSRDLYISGGENVYPAQVEAAYAEHPAIREIAVVGVPDPRFGEVGRAYVVLAPGAALDPEALRRFGRERLAGFKIPTEFVAVPALPRTETGKVQKFALPR
ncbi:MAG TPA: AMP-binding protein [Myxococcota bacterium]|nr:AMP-binding protein [Myxococcota bacterium]